MSLIDSGMKPIVRAVYYSIMFTGGFCDQKMMIYQIFTFRVKCIRFEIFNSKFYRIISNISK